MIECELFIGLIIHEIIQISVSIEILHFAGFDVCSGILVVGLKVLSRTAPVMTFFSLVRTNAAPLPGLTC